MKVPDRERLIELAGERVFSRGEEYFLWRRVHALASDGEKITAFVYGGKRYSVAITADGEDAGYECDCPEGASARFCKHCVAVCLSWLDAEADGKSSSSAGPSAWQDLREYLANLTSEELARLALDEAARNAGFRERLCLRMARAGGRKLDLSERRRLLDFASQLSASDGDAETFRAVLSDVESSLNNLFEAGYFDEAATLIEEALVFRLPRQTEASEKLASTLLAHHRKNCLWLGAAAESLAERLLRWQLSSSADGLGDVARTYSDLLGRRGKNEYFRLLRSEWDRLRSNGAAQDQRPKLGRLAALLEDVAECQGDDDLLIAVKSHRLEDASGYLELARLCKRKGRDELALDWALRGKDIFPADKACELYEFLATEYEARREWKEALGILFELFSARPSLGCYQRMASCARQIGEWGFWRERALNVARPNHAAPTPRIRSTRAAVTDGSALVRILLWENDLDAALRVAQQGGCDDGLWLELAKRLAAKQPDEALSIYKRLVANYAEARNSYAYEQAIEILRRIGHLMKKRRRRDEFLAYAKALREKHCNQRNFAKLLDRLLARHSSKRNEGQKSAPE